MNCSNNTINMNDVLNKISGSNITKDVKDVDIDNVNGNSYSAFVYKNEKVMNGGELYDGVSASSSNNEEHLQLTNVPKNAVYSF